MANGLTPYGNPVRMGTVISGTLRTQDMLRAFANELDYLGWSNRHRLCIEGREAADRLDATAEDGNAPEDVEAAQSILDEMIEALCEACPPNAYFGAHWGDGADIGFWEYTGEDE